MHLQTQSDGWTRVHEWISVFERSGACSTCTVTGTCQIEVVFIWTGVHRAHQTGRVLLLASHLASSECTQR